MGLRAAAYQDRLGAVDAAIREARWRTDYCVEPNSEKLRRDVLLREELATMLKKPARNSRRTTSHDAPGNSSAGFCLG